MTLRFTSEHYRDCLSEYVAVVGERAERCALKHRWRWQVGRASRESFGAEHDLEVQIARSLADDTLNEDVNSTVLTG